MSSKTFSLKPSASAMAGLWGLAAPAAIRNGRKNKVAKLQHRVQLRMDNVLQMNAVIAKSQRCRHAPPTRFRIPNQP
jgi:hypothetical protein